MNKLLTILCLLVTLIVMPVGVAYANWQSSEAALSVSAEWIYFLPTFDQPDYVMKGNPVTGVLIPVVTISKDVEMNRINQQFSAGYRIAADLDMPCFPSLIVEYTHFDPLLTADKSSPITDLSPVFAVPNEHATRFQGKATYSEQFKFDALDAFVQLYCFTCKRLQLQSLLGIKWGRLHFTDQIIIDTNPELQPLTTTVSDDLIANVIGPQLGFRGGWTLFPCLTLRGSVQGALFANMTQTKMNSYQTEIPLIAPSYDTTFTENPQDFWRVGSYIGSKVGIEIASHISLPHCEKKIPIALEGGYEFFYSPNLIHRICFMDRVANGFNDGLSFDEWSDFTMQGPYARVRLSF